MASLFHCTNSTFYYLLIPQHLAALHSFPVSVIKNFKQGGFVVSLLGHDWSLVGIDEYHEMTINKKLKSVITTLNMDNIKNKMHFLKYQTDIIILSKTLNLSIRVHLISKVNHLNRAKHTWNKEKTIYIYKFT